jgi:hypothetical protein
MAVEGIGGNVITYTAVRIATGSKSAVTVVPFGVGGTSVLQWAHGYLRYQTDFVFQRISNRGLSPSIFLWHQGEADSRHEGLAPGDFGDPGKYASYFDGYRLVNYSPLGLGRRSYGDALQMVLDQTREYFPRSHFGIALVSRCSGRPSWTPIRDAQMDVARRNVRAFVSADSDAVAQPGSRYDDCHFSAKGAEELGARYYDSVRPWLDGYLGR